MALELHCKDLGVANCNWTAEGETPADVVEQVVEHLEKEHGIDMPEPETILEGKLTDQPLQPDVDESVRIVVNRMQEALGIVPLDVSTDVTEAVGKVPTRTHKPY
ncbi:MAG: DUF1059 domain-containing protein [Anaerolineae bacterium]